MNEPYDYQIVYEPLIKSLEYTVSNLNENENFFGFIVIPTFNLEPKILANNTLMHKTPQEYLQDLYNLENSLPLCLITKNNCFEFKTNNSEVDFTREMPISTFQKRYLFNKKRFATYNQNQLLELAEIFLAENDKKIDGKDLLFLLSQFSLENFSYLNKGFYEERYFKDFKLVEPKGRYKFLLDKDRKYLENEERNNRGFTNVLDLIY